MRVFKTNQVNERRVIARKCLPRGICPTPASARTLISFNLRDVFVNTPCSIIPDVTITGSVIINGILQDIIDNYVITDCTERCAATPITSNLGVIFDGAIALNGTISLDPPTNCCQIDRVAWESATNHIAIGGENDPTAWRRICFIVDDRFPSFISVPPLGMYILSLNAINADINIGDYIAVIAEDPRNSNCLFYAEAYEVKLLFSKDLLICNDIPRESIAMVWFNTVCFCIQEREREEPPEEEEMPSNTKEDAEVLFGLNLGSWTYEQLWDTHILRQIKIR
jgi:hypothetical protein